MAGSFYQSLISMVAGIGIILLLTIRFRVPAFFALLIAAVVTGLGMQFSLQDTLGLLKEGFGNIMKSLSLIIILGTTLGVLLEQNGSTATMADYILNKVGEKRPAFAMSLTGFIVGLPIFCDSGYIVLSGLNRQLSKRTGISVIPIAASMATGLYSVHCMIPPHPGAAAAAAALDVDFGKLIGLGILVAFPAMCVGYAWSVYAGKKWISATDTPEPVTAQNSKANPKVYQAFLPVILPILLIACRSLVLIYPPSKGIWSTIFLSLGDPVIALTIGILLALIPRSSREKHRLSRLLQESIEKAGSILVIIGAGGAFGAVLAASNPGQHLSEFPSIKTLGILFPFLLTLILKTAQGSSTVAIITASSIILPLLPVLGLNEHSGRLLAVLSMGAGSMAISHANDAYFWVITKFSGLEMKSVLTVYSIATCWMAITAFMVIYLLSFLLS